MAAEEVKEPVKPLFISSNFNGHVFDVRGGEIKPGAEIITWNKKLKDNANQKWVMTEEHYIHLHGHPNLVIDVQGGGAVSGHKIILWNKKEGKEADLQRWMFNKYGQLRCKANKRMVIDVKGGSLEAGAELILWDKKKVDFENQRFHFQQVPPARRTSAALMYSSFKDNDCSWFAKPKSPHIFSYF
eukprot:TRINITY_DN2201_c0_g1_i1.p1 TRINITY_DN2201_c0_g1~~TRINITY_DN2201_c0_g1_i1.p1  ORF type:complete len:186 (+),score=58.05 TRINITY_DN2201_c0_g1_i1:46-603(+)